MSYKSTPRSPYGLNEIAIKTDRGVEFDAMAGITRQLKLQLENDGADFPALCACVHRNRQLWTILAADVAVEDNALPKDIRSSIFFLSEFIAQHSRKVLKKIAGIDVLIDINLAIMRGLAESGPNR